MSSPPILDLDAMIAPIAGDNPAGEPLPFLVRNDLDEKRKEINPNQFSANDPRRPELPKPADWSGIEQVARDTLTKSSKDLLVAARLTEALVKQHGFGGLRDALRLLRRLVVDCWDRIHPVIEDGDVERRGTAFDWLDDDIRGARFPQTVRTIPLTKTGEHNYTWQEWKDAQDAKGTVTVDAFDQAVTATPREYCQTVVDDIAEGLTELAELSTALSTKMGLAAPGMFQVRKALQDCQTLAQQVLQRKGPPPAAPPPPVVEAPPPGTAPPTDGAPPPPATHRAQTREDLLGRLADASAQLLQLEPQSPIAYMIQRAVKLARLPLPELMKVLVRDPSVLGQLDRDLDLGLEKAEKKDAAKAAKK